MNLSGWPLFAGVMLVAGVGIPVMAALNASLGQRLGSPAAAAAILFALAFAVALAVALLTGGPARPLLGAAPFRFYLGGLVVAFYVLSITWIAPRFGVGNAVFVVLLGQIASAALIDHFGLFGAARTPVDGVRLLGILLMVAGVWLARRPVIGS